MQYKTFVYNKNKLFQLLKNLACQTHKKNVKSILEIIVIDTYFKKN